MTGLAMNQHAIAVTEGIAEDLRQIRGIGARKQQWLEALGIGSVQDLAIASVDDLKVQLKQAGWLASRSEIEMWIEQAQQLLQVKRVSLPGLEVGSISAAIAPIEPQWELNSDGAELNSTSEDWRVTHQFWVELQTRVAGEPEERIVIRQPDTDWSEVVCTGTHAEPVRNWLYAQTKACRLAQTFSGSAIAIDIGHLRLAHYHQPRYALVATGTQRSLSGAIARGTPIALEVALTFSGLPLDNPLDAFVRYQVQGFARHLESGETVDLGTIVVDALMGDRDVYTATLPQIVLTRSGLYRLKIVATLLDLPCPAACFKVPVLQVL